MALGASFLTQWLTPSSLFLFLNLMIGTIVLTAKLGARRTPQNHHDHDHRLVRATSSLLERVRSINLSVYRLDPPESSEPDHPTRELSRSPSLLQRLKSVCRPDPEPESHADHDRGVKRSKSEHPSPAEVTRADGKMMTKSASEKGVEIGGKSAGASGEDEEESEIVVERRRPATTRAFPTADERFDGGGGGGGGGDATVARRWEGRPEEVGVDAKADDFINRFKQQLKLQRLESLKRFSDMLKGKGSE